MAKSRPEPKSFKDLQRKTPQYEPIEIERSSATKFLKTPKPLKKKRGEEEV